MTETTLRNPATQKQAKTWLTPEQIERIHDACLSDSFATYLQDRNETLIVLLADTGLRVGELVALATFILAYVFGYAMTVGPLMQEGVPFKEAMIDAFYSETASIAVMEIVAISTDLWLAGEATMGDVLFWSALVFSLSTGLIAAYPVNVFLIDRGVKEGMMNPAEMA